MSAFLEIRGLRAGYGPVEVIRGVDLNVNQGEIVVVLGANGAGKTTLMRAISGMIRASGSVLLDGAELVGRTAGDIVSRGMAHVPQGRGTFAELTVEDNLRVGAFTRSDREVSADVDRWLTTYPILGERRSQPAGRLSGGEQQMLAVARALMSRPRVLLLDEPSLGLAPLIVEDLFRRFAELNRDQGTTMLIVEQNAELALEIAARAYVVEVGEIVAAGTADELQNNDSIRRAYLGIEIGS